MSVHNDVPFATVGIRESPGPSCQRITTIGAMEHRRYGEERGADPARRAADETAFPGGRGRPGDQCTFM